MIKALKLLSVFLLLAAFTNCQKDDLKETEARHFGSSTSPVKYLYGADAQQAKQRLKAIALTRKMNTAGLNGEKSNGWAIDFSEVLYVKDSTGTISYTYRLMHPNMWGNQFYNLVLTDKNGQAGQITRVKYTMSDDFYKDYASGLTDLGSFEGSITFSPLKDGNNLLPVTYPTINPQPEPAQPAPNDPCDEDTVITIGGAAGGGGATPGMPSLDDSNNGSGRIPNAALEYTSCWSWQYIRCSEGNAHYGNNPACTAAFKGATILVYRCGNKSFKSGGAKNAGDSQLINPCNDSPIGVLPPLKMMFSISLRNNFRCQTEVMQGAIAVSSDLNEAFKQIFDNPNSVHNITYNNKVQLQNNDANAETGFIGAEANADGITEYNFEINFKNNYLNTATDLSIARTLIHENIHALLHYFRKTNIIYTMYDNPTYDQLLTAYLNKSIEMGTYPNLSPSPNIQHEFMTILVNDIAITLKAYGVSKGYSLPDQFYNDMAWGGLVEIKNPNGSGTIPNPAFINAIPSNTVRQRIKNRINAEESGQVINGIQPSGNSNSCNR